MSTTEIRNEVPTVNLAMSLSSTITHLAVWGVGGGCFAACNGRSMFGAGRASASEVTCKRCRKQVAL